ncbi:hypothetical protein CLAFUW4_00268 [Fulvia fulva]|uniref:Uncharacterized protein n=1 Tax=Passalora fulva TaxID=5499 RepID=A0A9Q8L5Y7_PASFU|nr:uncharacterized protein CLAFUR5_00270 [Fulvia fulva]KAK4634263.1 hypothetical protein CLAFUR4_00268 [Fulvia fulva]KAK4637196.1 hypothetical protein CLAFUR0_00269 [Fulvia fulva]UJO11481.1 hypothetical protein CLAFUR5_00270 [Fulvia fulva]WPV08308.1 hypothetical protein CLAFUW4_00268 [Fulvia fulva]WPV23958.1 hypothetical protein CLAFUW7_00272 [Fulvia fulva]
MALRRSTEAAERTSLETAVPTRELDPPPTYDSVWSERPDNQPGERIVGHVAQSGPLPVVKDAVAAGSHQGSDHVALSGASAVHHAPVRSREPASSDTPPSRIDVTESRPDEGRNDDLEEDSDYESRISTPRTLTPPPTVPPTLADGDEDEERRRWARGEDVGARR